MANIITILLLLSIIDEGLSDLQVYASSRVTYGKEPWFLQFRFVGDTAHRLVVEKNTSVGYQELLETDYRTITWKDSSVGDRSCAEVLNGTCTKIFDLQIPKESVNCTDTASYRGTVHQTNGSTVAAETYIEVKVVPDDVEDIKLLSGQNDTIPFLLNSRLILKCTGNVGDPPADLHWCIKRSTDATFHPHTETHDISSGLPSLDGCQYIQSSNLTYVVTDSDAKTTVRCYAGDGNLCNDDLIPHKEFTIRKATVSSSQRLEMFSWLCFVSVVGGYHISFVFV